MSNITLSSNASGTATFNIASPATNTNRTLTLPDATDTLATSSDVLAVSNVLLGVGQTWQNVSGSRTNSTSYQNDTNKPIFVSIRVNNTTTVLQVSSDNTNWVDVSNSGGSVSGTVSAIVPPGHYYRFNGTGTIVSWAELR